VEQVLQENGIAYKYS